MTATLQLNLSEALSEEELRRLIEFAAAQNKTIERVLYEAAKLLAESEKKEVVTA